MTGWLLQPDTASLPPAATFGASTAGAALVVPPIRVNVRAVVTAAAGPDPRVIRWGGTDAADRGWTRISGGPRV